MRPRLSDLIFWLWTAAWLATCTFGCSAPPMTHPAPPDGTGTLVWNKDFTGYGGWQREARKRFGKESVVFVCHGAFDHASGLWVCHPDFLPRRPDGSKNSVPVEAVATLLRDVYGKDVPILLVVCNEGGLGRVTVPGAYYARDIVWDRPGVYLWGVGSIDEFIEGSD